MNYLMKLDTYRQKRVARQLRVPLSLLLALELSAAARPVFYWTARACAPCSRIDQIEQLDGPFVETKFPKRFLITICSMFAEFFRKW